MRISDWSSDVCSSDLGGCDIAWLHRAHDLFRCSPQRLFQGGDHLHQTHRMTVADVQYALASHGRRIVERAEHAINDVVDIGEVARDAALPVNLDRFPGQDLSRAAEISHVRPSPRTADGEEAKAGLRKAIQLCVSRADRKSGG